MTISDYHENAIERSKDDAVNRVYKRAEEYARKRLTRVKAMTRPISDDPHMMSMSALSDTMEWLSYAVRRGGSCNWRKLYADHLKEIEAILQ